MGLSTPLMESHGVSLELLVKINGGWQTAFLSHFYVCGSHSLVTYCTMECALVGTTFYGILLLIGLGLG
jgi:hypothetical protein